MSRAVQLNAEVVTVRRVGAYHRVVLLAPAIAAETRPGQFVALAVGGPETSMLLRRAFSVHRAERKGRHGGTVEIILAVHGPGTAWLAERRPGDTVDVVGPLGRPFALPKEPVSCVLVGGGYGSAPLVSLAEALRARGCTIHTVLGAATADRLFGVLEAKRISDSIEVTTVDGSSGRQGIVSDVLPGLIDRTRSDVVYACGPMGMLAAVARIAQTHGAHSQCAVEETMACGIGVCMTCVLPIVGADGVTRMVRSCVDGPVFRGETVRWSEVGTVPADTLGALSGTGH